MIFANDQKDEFITSRLRRDSYVSNHGSLFEEIGSFVRPFTMNHIHVHMRLHMHIHIHMHMHMHIHMHMHMHMYIRMRLRMHMHLL